MDEGAQTVEIQPTKVQKSQSSGGTRSFPSGEVTRPTRVLKYSYWGRINAKNIQKNTFHLPIGELACFKEGAIVP